MNILPGTFGSRSMILYSTCDLKITFRGIFFPEQNNSGKSSCKLLKHTEIRRQNYNQNHNHYHKLFSIKILRYIPTNSRKIFRWPSLLLLFHWSLSFRKVTECQLRIKICFNFYYIIRWPAVWPPMLISCQWKLLKESSSTGNEYLIFVKWREYGRDTEINTRAIAIGSVSALATNKTLVFQYVTSHCSYWVPLTRIK